MGLLNPRPDGGGGTGFSLGDGTSVFANNTARNTYFTNNPGRLTQYEEDPFKLIMTGSNFQRRSGTSWQNVNNILKGETGGKGDKGDADEYFVLAASVAQTNSNKDITLTISGVTAYAAGQEAIFHTKTGTNDTANCRLQINALGLKRLLKEDGTEFGANELEPGTQIRAIYDGTDFLSDFARRSQTHFLDPADVTMTGDAYSVTDTTIPGTGVGARVIIGLVSEADNTGNVTLSVNGSTAYPVLFSTGSQIPAGAFPNGQLAILAFSNVGTVGWRAVNIRPARGAVGALVATYTVPAANYTFGREYIPGGLVLENANANVWGDFSPGALYEGALTADPQIRHYANSGYNFYFNPTTNTWRRAGPADAEFADAVWQDVDTADIPGLLDYRYPSDTLNFTWLGIVADEAAANMAATSHDDLTIAYVAFYDNVLNLLSGRSNAVGYQVYDVGTEDYGKRCGLALPAVHTNENIIGVIVEVLDKGTIISRNYMQYGNLGFSNVAVELDDGSGISLSAYGGATSMTFYLSAHRNNATVGANDNAVLKVYEWGS